MSYLEQFEAGVSEFNDGRFFECHDTFEELWMEARGERKLFLQGLIQSAVGLFHYMSGNTRGAHGQLTRALAKLGEFQPAFHGVDVATFIGDLERLHMVVLSALDSDSSSFDADLVPRLRYPIKSRWPDGAEAPEIA